MTISRRGCGHAIMHTMGSPRLVPRGPSTSSLAYMHTTTTREKHTRRPAMGRGSRGQDLDLIQIPLRCHRTDVRNAALAQRLARLQHDVLEEGRVSLHRDWARRAALRGATGQPACHAPGCPRHPAERGVKGHRARRRQEHQDCRPQLHRLLEDCSQLQWILPSWS